MPRRAPVDPGLQLIANYQQAIVTARMEYLSTGGHTADVIEQERTVVKALAARYGEALRADYLARSPQP